MSTSGSITSFLRTSQSPTLAGIHPGSELDSVQTPNNSKPFLDKRTEATGVASAEISFGSFRLFPTHFLLLEGDRRVGLGSRALQILIVLVERPGVLISKQELMARIWPNIFVGEANLSVHISALRRTLRDGQGENRFIINIPGRGYSFVASVDAGGGLQADGDDNGAAVYDRRREAAHRIRSAVRTYRNQG
jgi:DNA-binding winged helix-turn-helix (wHTH) protein